MPISSSALLSITDGRAEAENLLAEIILYVILSG
jgi:hypothetical protein